MKKILFWILFTFFITFQVNENWAEELQHDKIRYFNDNVSPIETNAKQAILIDFATGKVLLEKNSMMLMVPSSMVKIMTLYLIFQRLKAGRLKMNDPIPVSEKAWRLQGSKMFLPLGESVPVLDIIRGIAVQSGNDACVAIAEALGGTEEVFANEMTKVAHEIGAQNSTFKNASGWPEPGQVSTPRDLAFIAIHTIRSFPEYYSLYKEKDFTFNGIKQGNRNPLLYTKTIQADGLKTGHTEEGGYGLVASAVQNNRRLILVVNGYSSMSERAKNSELLMNWGFRESELLTLFPVNSIITKIPVWQGSVKEVKLIAAKNIHVLTYRGGGSKIQVEVVYPSLVYAPLKRGDVIGKLIIKDEQQNITEYPLVSETDVGKGGYLTQLWTSLHYFLTGKI